MVDKTNVTSKNQSVKAKTGERHKAVVQNASMEILIGGPYVKEGKIKLMGMLR